MRRTLPLLVALGILAGSSASAVPTAAAPTTAVQTGTPSVTDTSAPGATTAETPFDQFDPSLGSLLQVTFAFQRSIELTLHVSGFTDATGSASVANATLTFGDPTLGANYASLIGGIVLGCSGPPFPCESSHSTTTSTGISTIGFLGPLMDAFIGTGTWDAVLTLEVIATAVTGSASAEGTFRGPLTVTFLYEPADAPPPAVPEPGGLVLVGTVLPIFGVWAHRVLRRA